VVGRGRIDTKQATGLLGPPVQLLKTSEPPSLVRAD
jgi:hypothetical protein